MCHQRNVVQEPPGVIEFQDADGDHWKFEVREYTLLETMNNETPLEIDWLEWDPQERTLSDYGRCKSHLFGSLIRIYLLATY